MDTPRPGNPYGLIGLFIAALVGFVIGYAIVKGCLGGSGSCPRYRGYREVWPCSSSGHSCRPSGGLSEFGSVVTPELTTPHPAPENRSVHASFMN